MPTSSAGDPGKIRSSLKKEFNQREIDAAVAAMLLRDGCLEQAVLDKAKRLLSKLDEGTTLFSVLKSLCKISNSHFLQCVKQYQPAIPLGALLLELGLINAVQLKRALSLQEQGQFTEKLGSLLLRKRMVKEREITRVLAAQLGFDSLEPDISECEQVVLNKVTVKLAEAMCFIPIRMESDKAIVAFVDPLNETSRTEATRALGCAIEPVMASAGLIKAALAALHRQRMPRSSNDSRIAGEDSAIGRANRILQDGIRLGASDIHIEPMRDRVRVRLRIDGMLREQSEFPTEYLDSVISRLKIIAEADISERRRHQDGRIQFEDPSNGSISDLRISFYVTVNGEAVVLRVLNQNSKILPLNRVGMAPLVLERFRRQALDAPSGVIIVTGPTGSGKTSTLYSCVDNLNKESTSIITAEDPVEFRIEGISQCSINPKLGRSFAESLRHVVRQDPDIIVLGEIRDAATADSAIQAALTGHKVLTTFHTEDSIGCLLRLMNMNIESYLIASTIASVIAQRLLRKVCQHCARPGQPDVADLQMLSCSPQSLAGAQFVAGEGCEHCQYTGYSGRLAVIESLVLSESVRDAILQRKTSEQIRTIAIETSGLVTLLEDGIVKAAQGLTTISEIRRSLPRLSKPRDLQELRRLTGYNL